MESYKKKTERDIRLISFFLLKSGDVSIFKSAQGGAMMLKTILLGILFNFCNAQAQTERVIYGDDSRLDLFEVLNPKVQAMADATVLITGPSKLQKAFGGYKITAKSYSSAYGICASEPFANQPTAGYCSGFLVAPDIIVTAGHCVTSEADCKKTKFIFGFAVKTKGQAEFNIANNDVVGCKKLIAREYTQDDADYAVIQLDKVITHHKPLAINRGAGPKAGDPVGVIGYPAGLPLKVAFGANVRSSVPEAGYFSANTDSYQGNSGSAVVSEKTGLVEGILVRGDRDFIMPAGMSCYVDNICDNDGCRSEDVTRISEVAPYIPL